MNNYSVGQIVEKFKRNKDEVQFDIADDGATLLVFYQNPSEEEVSQFGAGNDFEIRFLEINGVIMITTKIGNLNWMDAPYTPHLSLNLTKIPIPNEGEGLGLFVILVDAVTGEIKSMRLVGLSEKFTRKLLGTVMNQKMEPFDKTAYFEKISQIYSKYQTKELVSMSSDRCKLYG